MSSIKKNLGYNILLSVANIIFPVITFPYISRVLGPEGTGTVNFAQAFSQYFVLVAALGIPLYGIREIARLKDNTRARSKAFLEISIIRAITTLLVLVPYFFIIFYSKKFNNNLPLYYLGSVFIVLNLTSIEWFFIGLENFRYITTRSVIAKAISICFLFFFVKTRNDVVPYFLISIITLFINGIINVSHLFKYVEFSFKLKELKFKLHLKPLLIIFCSLLAINIYTLLDTILLGFLATDKAVGLYSAALKITKISLTIITSLGSVLIPRLSYAIAKNKSEEVDYLMNQSFNFVFTLGFPMMACIFSLAPEIVLLFSGRDFVGAVLTLRIVSPLIIIIGLANIFSVQVLTALGKDKYVMFCSVLGAVISISANFILIPIFRENGAGLTNLATELLVTFATYLFANKFISLKFPASVFIGNLLSVAPYFLVANVARRTFENPTTIVFTTGIIAFILFIISQIFLLKNQIALSYLERFKKVMSESFKTLV